MTIPNMTDKTARLADNVSLIRRKQIGKRLTNETSLINGCFPGQVELRTDHLIISCRSRSIAEDSTYITGTQSDEQHCGGGGLLGMTGGIGEAAFIRAAMHPFGLGETHVQENTIGVSGWKI